jgi:biotin carboxyl carrier protein
MKSFKFTIRGNEYEVDIKSFDKGIAKLDVNGTSYNIELHKDEQVAKTPILKRSSITNPHSAHKIKKAGGNIFKVVAPLPGIIMQILVKEGDEIKKEENLLIYEAMKMENKLLSEKTGTVKSTKVSVGDNVLQGDVLLEIEIS